ncbi:increased loss of mitochondrial DNA protein 1 [Microdochium trichocladiopsis]|uniref:Increased loss of mitochondrial DNA protein 1 n=1 Tax=Microdochium trichocladiopsis TaxID=1682393 RepID=A0A9P9BNL6_9PEZI|nr:increased loss of mitochondrial DNA protein 1 [Microdochium trichocladiopsis]KAH7027549.1 increased loss of mitochondrial DNA protein 1 [Microdochium trichocladiopsis]
MALISTKTILTSLSLFHVTLAFFFFTNPNTIADQILVFVLGEAMGMPETPAFSTPSPPTAFLSIVLLFIGLSDLLTLSMPEEVWLMHHWAPQAPLRAFIFFVATVYTYFTNPAAPSREGVRMSHLKAPYVGAHYGTAGGGEALRNRLFFTFAFVEFLAWFWVWVTIKEDAGKFVSKKRRRSSAAGSKAWSQTQ